MLLLNLKELKVRIKEEHVKVIIAMFMFLLKISLKSLFRDQKKRHTDSTVNLFRTLIKFSRTEKSFMTKDC